VLPGTNETLIIPILEKESGKKAGVHFGVASNPEFLKEGSAVEDFFKTDRVVIGAEDGKSKDVLETLYRPLNVPIVTTTLHRGDDISAVRFCNKDQANEIGNLCKETGIDSYAVFEAVGLDSRINPKFFRTGIGFGGSCFPKDVNALIAHAKSQGINPKMLNSVIAINEDQPRRMIALLKKHLSPRGHTVGVLGLAFKPDTDDIRESRAIPVITMLLKAGARVKAYDPVAMGNFRQQFPGLTYTASASDVLDADAVLIVTEWKEFESLDYRGKLVIDGRRLEKARREAAVYEGVCW
jgi:UDPglucose 6-dehydrogenase